MDPPFNESNDETPCIDSIGYIAIAALKLFVLAIFGYKINDTVIFIISTFFDIGKMTSLHPILLQVSSSLCHNLLEPSEMTVVYSSSS